MRIVVRKPNKISQINYEFATAWKARVLGQETTVCCVVNKMSALPDLSECRNGSI